MAERFPPGSYDFESIRYASDLDQNSHDADVNRDDKSISNGSLSPTETLKRTSKAKEAIITVVARNPGSLTGKLNIQMEIWELIVTTMRLLKKRVVYPRDEEKGDFKPRSPVSSVATTMNTTATTINHVEAELIEQYELGVYITLVALRDGSRDLNRVRFRYNDESYTKSNDDYTANEIDDPGMIFNLVYAFSLNVDTIKRLKVHVYIISVPFSST
ncbi:PH, RCC1 and FYVE domains-containing protein 1-like protein [Tanacetum coccineum]|uniref:PH, RCC1 and FYVE domains-containing protein 1-like protein n=1 Tax=Tanacetum coccineum TaxID=301880 RepID=A0ABQ5GNE9_9ASTR